MRILRGGFMNKKELSERTGLSLRMIQFYTEEGIIPCCNLNTGRGKQRVYEEKFGFVSYVLAIKSLSDIGMSLSKIKKLKETEYMIIAGFQASKILRLINDD